MSGIFGIVSAGDCYETLIYGTDYHSHMGTEFGGIAVLNGEFVREIHNISHSQFKAKFFENGRRMEGNKGIGAVSSLDEQPVYIHSKFGRFCLVTIGFIENAQEIASQLMQAGLSFSEVSRGSVNMTELVAKLITRGETIVDGINHMFSVIEGSCSLLLLHEKGIYAARDRRGYTTLVLGSRPDGIAIASETTAFLNTGFSNARELTPGEVVLVNEKGWSVEEAGRADSQICTFLWVYTGFPASSYEGISAEVVRENCGRALARRDKDIEVDLVTGVPDSGVAHAIGYAIESGKPFRRPLVKYTPGYGRSYTPPSQKTRDLVATMKLVAIRDIIEGNRITVCEDSIVRGTQLKNYTVHKLWEAGAKEIHVRPACPPLMFPCRFNLSTRSRQELVARRAIKDIEGRDLDDVSEYVDSTTPKYRKMIDWIARDLGVTTLRYQYLHDLVEAVGLPREKMCLYCWNGECPAARSHTDVVTAIGKKKRCAETPLAANC